MEMLLKVFTNIEIAVRMFGIAAESSNAAVNPPGSISIQSENAPSMFEVAVRYT